MTVDPIFNIWVITIGLSALLAFCIWLEVIKKHRLQTLRIGSMCVLVLSIAGLLLRPLYSTDDSTSVLLLTPGYSERRIDSLVRQHPDLAVMHLASAKPFRNSKMLRENDRIEDKEIAFVAGDGLPHHLIDRLNDVSFKYINGTMPTGVVRMLVVGQTVHQQSSIRGVFNSSGDSATLKLIGPAGVEDSVDIQSTGLSPFELSFIPKRTGKLTYTLSVTRNGTVSNETIPIDIEGEQKLRILVLQSAPTFEVQYLKGYLTEKGHHMALRYQTTRNNFRYEFINQEPIALTRLSENILSNIDLVITDPSAVSKLSSQEELMLETSVKSGLGLLCLYSGTDKNSSKFFPFQITSIRKDTARIQINSKTLNVETAAVQVSPVQQLVPIVKNQNRILSGYDFRGAGKVGFQLINKTYQLQLSGDSVAYASIWSPLLEKIARLRTVESRIKILTPFPFFENEPIDIELISADEEIVLMDDSVRLPLQEDITVDNVWHARTWAGKAGWHTLSTNRSQSLQYFVAADSAWNSLSIANRIQLNTSLSTDQDHISPNVLRWEQIHPIIFYLMLLIAAGILWIVPRL